MSINQQDSWNDFTQHLNGNPTDFLILGIDPDGNFNQLVGIYDQHDLEIVSCKESVRFLNTLTNNGHMTTIMRSVYKQHIHIVGNNDYVLTAETSLEQSDYAHNTFQALIQAQREINNQKSSIQHPLITGFHITGRMVGYVSVLAHKNNQKHRTASKVELQSWSLPMHYGSGYAITSYQKTPSGGQEPFAKEPLKLPLSNNPSATLSYLLHKLPSWHGPICLKKISFDGTTIMIAMSHS